MMRESNVSNTLRSLLVLAACAMLQAGCSELNGPTYLDPAHAPKGAGWKPLFNGEDLSGWIPQVTDRPNSWSVVDGVLTNRPEGGHRGVNIYTEKRFDDFELYYEYRILEHANSGVFLRGLYELQIVDDHGVPSDTPKDWGNGGFWGKKAPCKNVSKPAGEWQSMYVKLVGMTATVVLNGEVIIDSYTLPGPTFVYRDLNLKEGEPGPILIQGDHGAVDFRHIMIRPIKH